MIITHLHLEDPSKNKSTLICRLDKQTKLLEYSFYGGINTSGIPYAISNLQCNLPIHILKHETPKEFTKRLIKIINIHSVENVINTIDINDVIVSENNLRVMLHINNTRTELKDIQPGHIPLYILPLGSSFIFKKIEYKIVHYKTELFIDDNYPKHILNVYLELPEFNLTKTMAAKEMMPSKSDN